MALGRFAHKGLKFMSSANYLAFDAADGAVAVALRDALAGRGVEARLAGEDLRRTDNLAALAEAVAGAPALVAFVSPAAAANDWVRREWMLALNNGRPIVSLQTADLPGESWLSEAAGGAAIDLRAGLTPDALTGIASALRPQAGAGRVVAMLNIKGGVGKTVLAANLFTAAHLADGRSVAFIDLDPQHNLTQYFLSPAERNRLRDEGRTIYAVLRGHGAIAEIGVPLNRTKAGNKPPFEIIAGDERLFEYTLDQRSDRDRFTAFARFQSLIANLRARFDAIVIDANPCATFLTRLAISAADHIVAPVRPEKYSLTGLNMLEHVVSDIRGRPLRPAEVSVLLNGVNDRVRSRANDEADRLTREEIAAAPFFGATLLDVSIPYSGALKATPSERYAPNPINLTAMMRVASRDAKTALVGAAAAILRRAAPVNGNDAAGA